MGHRNRSRPLVTIMIRKLVLVSVLVQLSRSFEISDEDSHQGLIPLPRIDRPGYWAFVEDPVQPNGISPYARLGHKLFKLPQTLIPYPRAGRMLLDPDFFDYETSLIPEYSWNNLDYPFSAEGLLDNNARSKKGSIAFPPRIGRKKRSVGEDGDDSPREKKSPSAAMSSLFSGPEWDDFQEEFVPDFMMTRQERKPSSRSRNSFVPRVGKKRSGEEVYDEVDTKRALAFTPRIGRASLIPRIGRNDPRFKVKSRGAFIPRIGRRAALTPRIGRSENTHLDHEE